jgi:hypothetical protein
MGHHREVLGQLCLWRRQIEQGCDFRFCRGTLRVNMSAVTARFTFVRMPLGQHGSRKAIKHWRGCCSSSLRQTPRICQPGHSCSGRQEQRKMKNKGGGKAVRQNRQPVAGLPTVRMSVAGIDLGSEQHWVCAPALDGLGREVADFGGTTAELLRLAVATFRRPRMSRKRTLPLELKTISGVAARDRSNARIDHLFIAEVNDLPVRATPILEECSV